MSFLEILVILIVALFTIKPEDIPLILRKVKSVQSNLEQAKKNLWTYFSETETNLSLEKEITEFSQLNFYLEKIAALEAEYQGDYQLESVKEYYRQLMNKKLNQELD